PGRCGGGEPLRGAAARPEDVDPGLTGGDGLEEDRVEVRAGLREHELDDAVRRVERDPATEGCERVPVEARAAAAEQSDAGDEEAEMEDELHHPLGPLRERFARVEVVEADEVEQREREEEGERDRRRSAEARVTPLDAIPREDDEIDGREEIRQRQRARDVPLQLVERDGDDREQEEAVEKPVLEDAVSRRSPGQGDSVTRHATAPMSSAISSTRARRERRSSSARASSTVGSPPFA